MEPGMDSDALVGSMSGLGSVWTCPPGAKQAEMALGWWYLLEQTLTWVLKDQGRRALSGKASLEPEPGEPSRPWRGISGRGNSQCRGLEAGRGSQAMFWGPGALREASMSWGQRGDPGRRQRQERDGPGPHPSWQRSTARGEGAGYGRAHRVRCRRVVDGRVGQKDGLQGEWTGLVDGLNLGVGDEKGNQGDSRVGLECPGGCWGLCAVTVRPGQGVGMGGGGRTGAPLSSSVAGGASWACR